MASRTVQLTILVGIIVILGLFTQAAVVSASDSHNNGNATVAPALDNTTDTETVLVQLAGASGNTSEGTTATVAERKNEIAPQQERVKERLQEVSGVTVERSLWLTNAIVIEVDGSQVDIDKDLATIDEVVKLHPNFELQASAETGTASSVLQANTALTDGDATYGVELIGAPHIWNEFGTRGDGVRVAVVDSGVDASHQDINLYTEDPDDPTYPGGWADFDDSGNQIEDSTPFDSDSGGHGTHVSGTVAGGNASGTAVGVAPDVELLHAKGLTGSSGTFAQVVAAMEWAVDNDADIISLSLGADASSESVYIDEWIEPIRTATEMGTVIVAASGNSGSDRSTSPGNVYDAIAVGAVDESKDVPSFSSGETVTTDEAWDDPPAAWPDSYVVPDVTAAGVSVESTVPDDNYEELSGTSMATPHVAGAAALLKAIQPDLTVSETKTVLEKTANNPSNETEDDRYGSGVVDVYEAAQTATTTNISGTVTNEHDGAPVANATVTVENTTAVSNASGEYILQSPTGEQTITVSAFGYATANQTVDVPIFEPLKFNAQLTPTVDARVIKNYPELSAGGNPFNATLEIANVESLSVDVTDKNEIPPENLTFRVGNSTIEPGEEVIFDEQQDGERNISVDPVETARGTVSLEYVFTGENTSKTLTTNQTTIVDPPAFEIQSAELPQTVQRFAEQSLQVEVKNTGEVVDTQPISYQVNESIRGETTVTLMPGEQQTISIDGSIDEPPGTYPQRLATLADEMSDWVTVDGPEFEVRNFTAPETVTRGDKLAVNATVSNVGTSEGTAEGIYRFAGAELNTTTVNVPADASETVTFTVPTDEFDLGETEHGIYTVDDSATATITIEGDRTASDYAIDGEYPAQSVFNAIKDWRNKEIRAAIVFEVISRWRGN